MKMTLEIYNKFMKDNNLKNYLDLLDYKMQKSKELDHLLDIAPIWPTEEADKALAKIKAKNEYYFFIGDILRFYWDNRKLYNLK